VTITIPLPEKISLNRIYAGVHWTKRKAWADSYHLAVLVAARQSQISAFSGPFPCRVEYRFKLKGKPLDASNLAFCAKLVEDGLVQCGIIPDDSPQYVKSVTLVTAKGEDVVEVTLYPSQS